MQVHISFTSHARAPPLHRPPNLKYDLRRIQNPPKDVRDRYTGIDKRLREWMVEENGFVELLQQAEEDVRRLVHEMKDGVADETAKGEDIEENSVSSSLVANDPEGDHDDEGEKEEDMSEATQEPSSSINISVSCFCAMGKHRSVALVEELARRDWPRDWIIDVVHRDLTKSKAGKGGKGARQKGKWKGGDADED